MQLVETMKKKMDAKENVTMENWVREEMSLFVREKKLRINSFPLDLFLTLIEYTKVKPRPINLECILFYFFILSKSASVCLMYIL